MIKQNDDDFIFRETLFLLLRFNIYYLKKCFCIPLNFLDKQIGNIFDEYSYYYEFRKDWKKRRN